MADNALSAEFIGERKPDKNQTAAFRDYGNERFRLRLGEARPPGEIAKTIDRYFSFDLPAKFQETPLGEKSLPAAFVARLPAVRAFEEWLYSSPAGKGENFRDIKSFYQKWLTEREGKEKDYYALSTIQMAEKNANPANALKYVFSALIYMFDENYRSMDEASKRLGFADDALAEAECDDHTKRRLTYLVKTLRGAALTSRGEHAAAALELDDAAAFEPNAATAWHFAALNELARKDDDRAALLLSKIVEYDVDRMRHGVEERQLDFLAAVAENAGVHDIFRDDRFALLFDRLKETIEAESKDGEDAAEWLETRLRKLAALKLHAYYDQEVERALLFYDHFAKKFAGTENKTLALVGADVKKAFKETIERIKAGARESHYDDIAKEMKEFEAYFAKEEMKAERTREEFEGQRDKLDERRSDMRDRIETRIAQTVRDAERELRQLENSSKYNPGKSFTNALMKSALISMAMILVGGFVGRIGESSPYGQGFGGALIDFFATGLKWGGIVFLIGLIFSFIVAFSVMFEARNVRSSLLKRATQLRNQKERELQRLEKNYEAQKERLDDLEKRRLGDFADDKRNAEEKRREKGKEMKKDADAKIAEIAHKLDEATA